MRAVGDETIVADAGSEVAHALSALGAAVLQGCLDGSTDDEIATSAGCKLDEVWQAVAELDAAGLIVPTPSRRWVLRSGAVATGAVVATVALPMAYAAATTPPQVEAFGTPGSNSVEVSCYGWPTTDSSATITIFNGTTQIGSGTVTFTTFNNGSGTIDITFTAPASSATLTVNAVGVPSGKLATTTFSYQPLTTVPGGPGTPGGPSGPPGFGPT